MSLDNFFLAPRNSDGLESICKKCKDDVRKYRLSNIENIKEHWKEYYSKNKKKLKDYSKKRARKIFLTNSNKTVEEIYENTPFKKCSRCKEIKSSKNFGLEKRNLSGLRAHCKRCKASNRLQSRYKINGKGLTLGAKKMMIEVQGGKCAICSEKILSIEKGHVDHDHKSNKVRQVLCPRCNRGLGHFKDSIEILEKAIKYLRFHSKIDLSIPNRTLIELDEFTLDNSRKL